MNTWAMSVKWAEIAGGTFDPLALSGPAYSRKRQALLSALHGYKLPISKCGVNRLVDDLVTAYGVSRDQCYAMMLSDVRNHIQREVIQAERNTEPVRTAGQQAYERDLILMPAYHDGGKRKSWNQLGELERWTWERNPTTSDEERTALRHEEILAGLASEVPHSRIREANGTPRQWTYKGDGGMVR